MAEWGGVRVRPEPGDRSVPASSPCSHCSHQPGLVGDEALLCEDCQARSDVITVTIRYLAKAGQLIPSTLTNNFKNFHYPRQSPLWVVLITFLYWHLTVHLSLLALKLEFNTRNEESPRNTHLRKKKSWRPRHGFHGHCEPPEAARHWRPLLPPG